MICLSTKTVLRLIGGTLVLFAAACARQGDQVKGSNVDVVRDSAGVTIVDNLAPQWRDGDAWRVGASPLLSVGGLALEPVLYRVRGALRNVDRQVIVANGASQELLMYDSTGVVVGRFGGRGSGPGEFQEISLLRSYRGDSLLVFDAGLLRASIFDGHTRFARSFQTITTLASGTGNESQAPLFVVDALTDGTLLASRPILDGSGEPRQGAFRRELELYHLSSTGAVARRITRALGLEQYYQETNGGVDRRLSLFGRSSYFAGGGDRAYVADSDAYEIRAYAATGSLTMIIRRSLPPRVVTPADITWAVTRRVSENTNPEGRQRMRALYESMDHPATMPAFGWAAWQVQRGSAVRVDREGNLWVMEYRARSDSPNEWSVFSESGRWLGRVSLPAGFIPTDIGDGQLLGVFEDVNSVEYVQLYALIK